MQPALDAIEAEVGRLLAGAALWVRREASAPPDPAAPPGDAALVLVAGWEDDHKGRTRVVPAGGEPAGGEPAGAQPAGGEPAIGTPANDTPACRPFTIELAATALRSRRARSARCPCGARLLAVPAPRGSHESAAVLRLDDAGGAAGAPPGAPAVRRAARRLRTAAGLVAWQAEQRAREVERRRTAAVTLNQLLETAEAFRHRYEAERRERSTAESSATRLDDLARETLRDAETGRVQVAHELHDTAAQALVSAHRFLEAAEGALAQARHEQVAGYVEAAHAGLMTAIGDVRRVLNTLVPPGLEELGVANALAIYVRDRVPAGIDVHLTGSLPRAEGWLEARLFAMAAEAIRNAVDHGQAATIQISLSALRGRGIITISDDGVGFDPAATHRQTEGDMGTQRHDPPGHVGGRSGRHRERSR